MAIVPTDLTALVNLLTATPHSAWEPIETQLIEQIGEQDARPLLDQAQAYANNSKEIQRYRAHLTSEITEAVSALRAAESRLAHLNASEVYDVEYDTTIGTDLAALLADAHRLARTALLVQQRIAST